MPLPGKVKSWLVATVFFKIFWSSHTDYNQITKYNFDGGSLK